MAPTPPRPRPFRFGVQATGAPTATAWRDLARRAEALGYATLTMPDHVGDQLAPAPALAVVAEATTTLRIGALVWANDYRHPVVLAKELATLDVLSEGRLEIGLGAGWERDDYERAGIAFDPPGVRIDRLAEALTIIEALLGEGACTFSGRHYRVRELTGRPRPVQRPRPPLLLGGGGRRMLTLAARRADIVGINGTLTEGRVGPGAIESMSAAAVDEKVAIVRAAAGARAARIELSIRAYGVLVTDDRTAGAEALSALVGWPAPAVLDSPFALVGPPTALVEDLLARRERWGFSYVIVGADEMEAFAPVVAALAGT